VAANYRKREGVAAFVVLHDSALVDLCVVKPTSLLNSAASPAFGDKRVEMYGKEILDALRRFHEGDRASNEGKPKVSSPAKETLRLLEEGRNIRRDCPNFAHAPCVPLSPRRRHD